MSIAIYFDTLQQHLQTAMGDRVETFADYNAIEDGKVSTPAILIDIEREEVQGDQGDDRFPLRLNVTIYCVLSLTTPAVQREVRAMAIEVMKHLKRFAIDDENMVARRPEGLGAGVGPWRAGEHGYESHEVLFEQQIYLGESVWAPSGVVPSEVWLGVSPAIGVPHEPDYEQIGGSEA